jgi:ribulose-5-phosphate 4-epimerase/fuculose-1-phosphate aldolase
MNTRLRITNELIEIGRLLHQSGVFRARAGNLSARLPDGGLIITRAATHKGLLTPADFLRLDESGEPTEAGRPSSELRLHLAAYATPEIGAVAHAHPLACTTLAHLGRPLAVELAEEGAPVLGAPPLLAADSKKQQASRWGAAVEEGTRAALLAEHGLVVAGRDARDVLCKVELCEWLAELQLRLHDRRGSS